MFLLNCVGYFHVYRTKNVKFIIRIISVIYSLFVVSLTILCGVVQTVGSFLPPRPTRNDAILDFSFPFFYLYGQVILCGTFIQGFQKTGYYSLIDSIKNIVINIQLSHKIIIFFIGVVQIILLGFSLPDFFTYLVVSKEDVKESL